MKTSESIAKITAAMVAVQSDDAWGAIGKDKTAKIPTKSGGEFKYGYADLATCYAQLIPLFARHKIAIFQPTSSKGTDVIVTTILAHDGEWISEEFTIPAAERGAQAIGSAATYAKRYALLGMCAVASEDEDDDGKAASEAARREHAKPAPKKQESEVKIQTRPPAKPAPKDRVVGEDDEIDNLDVDRTELLAHIAASETESDLVDQRPAIVDLKRRLKEAGKQGWLDHLTKVLNERFAAITGRDPFAKVDGAKTQEMPGWGK